MQDDERLLPMETSQVHKVPLAREMKLEVQRDATRQSGRNLRLGILIWLTLQNSVHTLLLRYSRARNVDKMFLSSSAVFFTEIMKLVTCMLVEIREKQGVLNMLRYVNAQVFGNPWDTMKVCVPAMIYTVQNNLFYLAASNLEAATFMITSQLKIFTTAIFSVVMLKKSLSRIQWFALATLFTGVSLVQIQQTNGKTNSNSTRNQQPFIGFIAVFVASCLSGFAGIYFEKILKGAEPVTLWMRNIQMAMFSIPSSLIASLVQDWKVISEEGLLYGYDSVVWITVFWYCVGGLSVAVCIKYADNIAKNFATSVAIIISTIGSMYIFGFVPDTIFLFGATLVIASIFLYSSSQTTLQLIKQNFIC